MSYIMRPVARWAAFAGVTLATAPAWAWVETQIRAYGATVDVERDGTAVVSSELVMSVRGGPLKRLEISGVDSDAEPLPDATVTPTVQGAASVPLLVERRDDGVLLLEVDYEKGLRTGRYAFAYRYRTALRDRGLIQRRGSDAELRWQSPRFDQGIDSMRVVFRVPPTATAPSVPSYDVRDPEASFGAFIGNLRRAPDKDELEIVRPHVGQNEAVVWRAVVGSELGPSPEPTALPAPSPARKVAPIVPKPALDRLRAWGLLAAVAFVYGLLVALKWRGYARACRLCKATPSALVPLPIGVRAPLAGLAVAAAVGSALFLESPTWAGVALAVGLLAAALRAPKVAPSLRGPGRWLPLTASEVFAKTHQRLPGALLDASRFSGFLLFALLLAGALGAGGSLLSRSPHDALLVFVAASLLVPLFLTGRQSDLPKAPVEAPRSLFRAVSRAFEKRPGTKVVPWGRLSDANGAIDELRLLLKLKGALDGLVAVEFGAEVVRGLGGSVLSPYVLVRAREGSAAHQALPRAATFTRGRKPEERVAILRPSLPTTAGAKALLQEVLDVLEERPKLDLQGPGKSKARSSAGRSERTAKLGRVPSPLHAT
jgi:hypothetical protein